MHLKKTIRDLITASAARAREADRLAFATMPAFEVEAPKHAEHGDLATNLALVLASQAKRPPRQVAAAIIEHLAAPAGMLQKVEMAGPGFINFFIADH
jgi:arginyl-tRNA synthetase